MTVGLGNNLTARVSQATDAAYVGCRLCRWHPCWHLSAGAYAEAWTSPSVLSAIPSLLAAYGLRPDTSMRTKVAVHVRCSDVPFARHPLYHLPSPTFWKWALQRLLLATASRDAVVHHDAHWTPSSRATKDRVGACSEYAAAVCRVLERAGFRVTLATNLSDRQAFEAMLGSEAVLTTTPSSFSFLPGLTKLKGHRSSAFITPQFYTEVSRFAPYYQAQPRGWRVGARDRCGMHLANLSGALPAGWAMHDSSPVLHASVPEGKYLAAVRSYARALAAGKLPVVGLAKLPVVGPAHGGGIAHGEATETNKRRAKYKHRR